MVERLLHLNLLPAGKGSVVLHHSLSLLAIITGLLIATAVVYWTGGTSYAYPYLIVIPIALAAALYRITGGLVAAVAAGLLLGPFMPLETSTGEMQSTSNWLIRTSLYALIGGALGALFNGLHRINRRGLEAMRLDPRTQLLNTAALDEDLAMVINRLAHKDRRMPLGQDPITAVQLSFIRITDLSDILETFGPDTADEAMLQIIRRIRENLDDRAYAYRFSVSEIVLLDEQTTVPDPLDKVRVVEEAFEQMIEIHGIPIKLEPILGTYQVTSTDITPMTMIQRARLALSSAVERGVNHNVYGANDEARMHNLVRVITGVRRGLDNNEFDLHFQPKFCLQSGTLAGSEGLIRWYAPNGDLIPPGQFMPKVEATSLIDPVTRFVVHRACEHLQKDPDGHVSINFSARNLLDDDLIQWLPEKLASFGVAPSQFEIELTESAFIGHPGRAQEMIQELRRDGFEVSIDDFGTGYSSFEYLSQLSVTGLKIDKTFVRRLSEGGSNQRIMQSMIDLGKALDLTVIIEGIEHAHEYELLREMGADMAQGFYMQRPLPESEYLVWKEQFSVTADCMKWKRGL